MARRLSRDGHAPLRRGVRCCPHCGAVLSQYNPTETCWQIDRWGTDDEEVTLGEVLDDYDYSEIVRSSAYDVRTGAPV